MNNGGNSKIAASAGAAQTAGTAFNVTLTAQDAYGNVPGTLSGSKAISVTGPSNAPNNTAPSYPATATFSAGTATISVTLYDAQTTTMTVTDTADSYAGVASPNITVGPGANAKIAASAGATQTAGTAFNVTLTAQDTYGNTGVLSGTKNLSITGPSNSPAPTSKAPSYPASATFSGGTATISVTLYDAQTTTLTVGDTTTPIAGAASSSITVSAGAAGLLAITPSGISGSTSATANLGPLTVAETDAYSNTTTTAETVNLSSSAGSTFATSQFGTSITSVSIPGGSSSTTFYFGNTTTGTKTITAAATGLTSGTRTVTTTTAPAGLFISITAHTGGTLTQTGCSSVSASYTCTVTGTGSGGTITFNVLFTNATGTGVVYSTSQSSTISMSGHSSGSTTVAANSFTSGTTMTAGHTGGVTATSTVTFGPYTLTLKVGS